MCCSVSIYFTAKEVQYILVYRTCHARPGVSGVDREGKRYTEYLMTYKGTTDSAAIAISVALVSGI
jgi:hypothetical protein